MSNNGNGTGNAPNRTFFDRFNALVDAGWLARLRPPELRVLLAYMRHMDLQGVAHPSNVRLARAAGHADTRNVRRARERLVAHGLLERVTDGGTHLGDRAKFRVLVPPAATPQPDAGVDPVGEGPGDPAGSAGPWVPATQGGGSAGPEKGGSHRPTKGAQGRGTVKEHNNAGVEPPGFTRFWEAWPRHRRKAGKAECLARWRKRNLERIAPDILAALECWKPSADWKKDDGQYVPAPLSWLGKSPWEAAVAPKPAQADDDDSGVPDPDTFVREEMTQELAQLLGVPWPPGAPGSNGHTAGPEARR